MKPTVSLITACVRKEAEATHLHAAKVEILRNHSDMYKLRRWCNCTWRPEGRESLRTVVSRVAKSASSESTSANVS